MSNRRKRGTGSVSHRKDGRWEGRYVVGYDEKGLPRTKNVLAKTKRECQEKLAALRAAYETPKQEKLTPAMPFGAWMDYWYSLAGSICYFGSIVTKTSSPKVFPIFLRISFRTPMM